MKTGIKYHIFDTIPNTNGCKAKEIKYPITAPNTIGTNTKIEEFKMILFLYIPFATKTPNVLREEMTYLFINTQTVNRTTIPTKDKINPTIMWIASKNL